LTSNFIRYLIKEIGARPIHNLILEPEPLIILPPSRVNKFSSELNPFVYTAPLDPNQNTVAAHLHSVAPKRLEPFFCVLFFNAAAATSCRIQKPVRTSSCHCNELFLHMHLTLPTHFALMRLAFSQLRPEITPL
jgi:hypothetical protein